MAIVHSLGALPLHPLIPPRAFTGGATPFHTPTPAAPIRVHLDRAILPSSSAGPAAPPLASPQIVPPTPAASPAPLPPPAPTPTPAPSSSSSSSASFPTGATGEAGTSSGGDPVRVTLPSPDDSPDPSVYAQARSPAALLPITSAAGGGASSPALLIFGGVAIAAVVAGFFLVLRK